KAEDLFRQAIKAHKGTGDEVSRYRIALARVLLREQPFAAPAPAPADKTVDAQSSAVPPYVHPVTALLLTATIGAQPIDDPEPEVENPVAAKRVKESVDLALKVL